MPITDSDGNDIPGVRMPDVTVPLATYTGWALRAGPQANDGCENTGQFIPFAQTESARAAAGDPRPSVAQRYPTFDTYDGHVIKAMDTLIQQRLELCEDGPAELQRLRLLGVAQGVPNPPASFAPYSFALANSSIKAFPSSLRPNGKLVPVSLTLHAPMTCETSCKVVQVSGTDGATAANWQITGPLSVNLKASGGPGREEPGRVYSVQLQCTDAAKNSLNKTVTVRVGDSADDDHGDHHDDEED
ncbi:MAG: alpha/beta hydrolase domain-containing protein [Pseudomonadota bacterium]|nr:alpha/beta hydrolase domain-containing protein [Pseudomonadota bacterium]